MPARLDTEAKAWLREAERKGWSVRLTKGGHMVFVPPPDAEDQRPVTVPSRGFQNNRGLKNARAQLRRQGLDV